MRGTGLRGFKRCVAKFGNVGTGQLLLFLNSCRYGPGLLPTGALISIIKIEVERMTLLRTGEPAAEPVTVAEVKSHLRLQHASEDDLIAGLIRAAREEVERATGMALIDQTWRLVLDRWPRGGRAR